MNSKKWTSEDISRLNSLKKEGKQNKEIAETLGKTLGAVERKMGRIPNPDDTATNDSKKWSGTEMHQLYAYLQSKQSYKFISQKLSRSPTAVERKAQTTDWKAWHLAFGHTQDEKIIKSDDELLDNLSQALVVLARHDSERLSDISEEEFFRKINFDQEKISFTFKQIVDNCVVQLDSLGLNNPDKKYLGKGTYIIVGDSHGKHTRTKMFEMLNNVTKDIKINNIIHIGHLLDDDNDISYQWGNFDNLIILTKKEELQLIQNQRHKFKFAFEMVRGGVILGNDLIVMNQDLITDYVKTPISSLDQEIIDEKAVVNSHRLEFASKCSESNSNSYYASPGCLCEPHVVKTIKQIDFEDHKTVKRAFNEGFIKYRRMELLNKLWKNGMLIVSVDESGEHTILPCIIKKVEEDYATCIFNKIYTSNGIFNPEKKIMVVGDLHSPKYSAPTLSIQQQIAKDYAPDVLVNIGDAHDNHALNHHDMDRGRVIRSDILKDAAQTHYILKKMAEWAKEKYIIIGNHERFSEDFIAKYPQFENYLDIKFLLNIDKLDYSVTELKNVLTIGPIKFIHGDMVMFGQNGNKLEKSSRTFGDNVFIGHIHNPGIRFGCYSIGCSCDLDQGYNEPNASTWMNGFGLCSIYKGVAFPTTIALSNNKCILLDSVYVADKNCDDMWRVKSFNAEINYTVA